MSDFTFNTNYDSMLKTALGAYAESITAQFEGHNRLISWLETPERKRLREMGPVLGPDQPPMTVSELIAELQALPQDAEVWTRYDGDEEPYPQDDDFLCSDGRVFV